MGNSAYPRSGIIGILELDRAIFDVTRGIRLDRNDLLKSFFRRHLSRRSPSSFTYISEVFRAILSLDLKLHDVIRTDLGNTVTPSDRLGRSISGNSRLQLGTRLFARGGENGTPFSGEFLGW